MTQPAVPPLPQKRRRLLSPLAIALIVTLCLVVGLITWLTITTAADCVWSGVAQAWVDSDGDGQRDPGEYPLPRVVFHVDDTRNQLVDVGSRSRGDSKGEAVMSVWLPGCPSVAFEVYPDVPAGMKLTTPGRLADQAWSSDNTFAFGFAYLPGVPTGTPPPPGPTCMTYTGFADDPNNILTDIAAASDGSVWAATYGRGVARYDPATDAWTSYSTKDGLAHDEVRNVSIAPDGAVYFNTGGGVSRYVAGEWSEPIVPGVLADNWYWNATIAPDGTLWMANQDTLWHIDSVTLNELGVYPMTALTDQYHSPSGIFAAPDGSIWLPISNELVRLLPTQPGEEPRWLRYERGGGSGFIDAPISYVNDIAAAPDGSLWFATTGNVAHYDPVSDAWTSYDRVSTDGMFRADSPNTVAVASDGSVWVAGGARIESIVYHFIPVGANNPVDIWRVYDSRDGLPKLQGDQREDPAQALAIAPDGALWLGTLDAATRCTFP